MKEALTFDDVQILPNYSDITSRHDCILRAQFTKRFTVAMPLIASPMDSVCDIKMMLALYELGGVGCLHRFMSIEDQVAQVNEFVRTVGREYLDSIPVVAAIGATGDFEQRASALLSAGANVLLIDVAHGDHIHVKRALQALNKFSDRSKFEVIAGNIATLDAAERLTDWGADAIRVGIGGGSMCETRVRTGVGVPQLDAIMKTATAAVPIIADGGIRYPGDVAKALAAGSDTVMIGSLFSGTTEAPGMSLITGQWPHEKKSKIFRGSASAAIKAEINGQVEYVEGTAKMVPDRGPVKAVVNTILDGIRSSMSYVGARTLLEFRAKADFIRITNSGLVEAHPHGLNN